LGKLPDVQAAEAWAWFEVVLEIHLAEHEGFKKVMGDPQS